MPGPPDALMTALRTALLAREEILEAYLFGSQARGAAQPHSDVDVAVWADPARMQASAFGYAADVTTDLMAALHRNDVDVVVLNRAPPMLYHRVLRDGVRILARDPAATTAREGYALSRWFDWLPVQERIDAGLAAWRASRETP